MLNSKRNNNWSRSGQCDQKFMGKRKKNVPKTINIELCLGNENPEQFIFQEVIYIKFILI
jgi:hypothetical protein